MVPSNKHEYRSQRKLLYITKGDGAFCIAKALGKTCNVAHMQCSAKLPTSIPLRASGMHISIAFAVAHVLYTPPGPAPRPCIAMVIRKRYRGEGTIPAIEKKGPMIQRMILFTACISSSFLSASSLLLPRSTCLTKEPS